MKRLLLIVCLFVLSGCDDYNIDLNLSTDKSMYEPDEEILLNVEIINNEEYDINYLIDVSIFHINRRVLDLSTSEFEIKKQERITKLIPIDLSSENYMGYLMKIDLKNRNGRIMDSDTIALDISSNWNKYPRYGYIADYGNLSKEDIESRLESLSRFHINGLQFYDWQYKHHMPLSLEGNTLTNSWFNIANKKVNLSTIEYYLDIAKERNITTMNYNLIFGAYSDYESDGLSSELSLYKNKTLDEQDYHDLPSSWATQKLMIMDPSNVIWQDYIINQERNVLNYLDFDGWHIDQLGNRGVLYNNMGERIFLDDTFNQFISAIGSDLDIELVFNFVDNYGLDKAGNNEQLSFIYNEVWQRDKYIDLKEIIDNNITITNSLKNSVLAAYMNYDKADNPGMFNTPGILLTDAVIFASGGSHIELGDIGMLSKEYFPNINLEMSEELTNKLIDYYDFLVAYQNLLRDDVVNINNIVEISDYKLSKDGIFDTVWYFVKATDDYEMIHFINLLGNDNYWRDSLGLKKEPEEVKFKVKYYSEELINNIFVASPDYNDCVISELKFDADYESGIYEFTVPKLKYWDMIILEKEKE
ncbi:glycoside hydrolase family 66 protein [Mycoplasmatota bacterium zrk1]